MTRTILAATAAALLAAGLVTQVSAQGASIGIAPNRSATNRVIGPPAAPVYHWAGDAPCYYPREFAVPTAARSPAGLPSEAGAEPHNPWLDWRLTGWMLKPGGQILRVPGFYAADAKGGDQGCWWKLRVTPDEPGVWYVLLQFEYQSRLNLQPENVRGAGMFPDGAIFRFGVGPVDQSAPGFLSRGPLEIKNRRYLQHRDGTVFLKGGTNSPENFLAYTGFDGTQDMGNLPRSLNFLHSYGPHVADWRPGDPNWSSGGDPNAGKGIIGSLNYLAEAGLNSLYFLPMNLGGDGQDTSPFLDQSSTGFGAVTHYDVGRMEQWNRVFEHAQRRGLLLELVLAEEETPNVQWLGNGLTPQRKLYFKNLAAMFGHHLGLRWILCEENSAEPTDEFTVQQLNDFAAYIDQHTAFDHPVAVHCDPNDLRLFEQILQSPSGGWLKSASLQLHRDYEAQTEQACDLFDRYNRDAEIAVDEQGTPDSGVTGSNADDRRKLVTWDVLLSGGSLSWYLGAHYLPLGGDLTTEDFRTRQSTWQWMRYARELIETFPFWRMESDDALLSGEWVHPTYGEAEVLAEAGENYIVYYSETSKSGQIDLRAAAGTAIFDARWFDPRNGVYVGSVFTVQGGAWRALPACPSPNWADWVLTLRKQ